jgi:hypothetical protein
LVVIDNLALNEYDDATQQIFEAIFIQIGQNYGFKWEGVESFEDGIRSQAYLDLMHALIAEKIVENKV